MPDIGGIPYVESGDLVSAYPAVSQSLAKEVSDQLASKLPYAFGTATPSTTESGFLWYDSNSTPAAPKFWDGSSFQALTSGKILQMVFAGKTDHFSTTSATYVDVTGLSVSITPSAATSKVLCLASVTASQSSTAANASINLVRNSTAIAQGVDGSADNQTLYFRPAANTQIGSLGIVFLDSPNTTSATTYKIQMATQGGNTAVVNRRGLDTVGGFFSSILVMEVGA